MRMQIRGRIIIESFIIQTEPGSIELMISLQSGVPAIILLSTRYFPIALRPEIAKEWDYDKNELKPTQVSPSSSKVAWWKCERGHSWKTIISTRGHNGCGCPYCSGNNVVDGVNDLATINPKLSSEWDYEKNDLKPNQVAVSSNRLVWWKCEKGHSWRATVACRSWGGNGCPYCRGRIPYTSRCVN